MKSSFIAFAGQPNTGKSTLFNSVTGSRQHVANYPGITVEKKTGTYTYKREDISVVDLPGTYSLTSYSPEERVTRDVLLNDSPELLVSILDVLSLDRQLLLLFQLIEMGKPILVFANKKDVAERRGLELNTEKFSSILGLPVVYDSAKNIKKISALKEAINDARRQQPVSHFKIRYTDIIEETITSLEGMIGNSLQKVISVPVRWLAIKLIENDQQISELLKVHSSSENEIFEYIAHQNKKHEDQEGFSMEVGIAVSRNRCATEIIDSCIKNYSKNKETVTDKIDKIVLHRFFGPLILLGIMYIFYWITLVGGQKVTDKIFPWFQYTRNLVAGWLPAQTLIQDGLLRAIVLNGIIDGAIMILNYVPIFYVLYLSIAFLEYTGYMARIAFIMDRILRSFGLHGQSTLPMLLSGAIIGGCAVPGIMATRTIRDRNARLITILILPLLNCMSKVPFYVLMTSIFFQQSRAAVLWGFSISTLVVSLLIAKLFSKTIVKGETEPFVLELPDYQLPTIRSVFIRGTERLLLFIKKVATLVVAVAVVIWAGVSFPGLKTADRAVYENNYQTELERFKSDGISAYSKFFATPAALVSYVQFEQDYKISLRVSSGSDRAVQKINEHFIMKNPEFAKIAMKGSFSLAEEDLVPFKHYFAEYSTGLRALKAGKLDATPEKFYSHYMGVNPYYFALVRTGTIGLKKNKLLDSEAKRMNKAVVSLLRAASAIKRDIKNKTLHGSLLGTVGQFVEPLSSVAGIDWRMNVAIIGSFAAKEALVSTLGTIYSIQESDTELGSIESGIRTSGGFRPIHALAIMVFIAFFPPCIATMMMTKVETGSWKWLLFQIIYPIVLGFVAASLVFQCGVLLGF